jgi:PPOX class probable F420-dependent enzyme
VTDTLDVVTTNVLPDESTDFGRRVRERLRHERVIWLTTVSDDGTPQPNPVGFVWDGGQSVLIYNRPDARRLMHVRRRPRVSLNLDGNGQGGDIVVLAGDARVVDDHPLLTDDSEYLAKYAGAVKQVFGDLDMFAREYPVAMRIRITKVRGF